MEDYSLANSENEKKILYDNASQLGIILNEDQIDLLCLFVDLLIEWNTKVNLIGIIERRRIIDELLLDSIIPIPYLPEKGNLVDLGSGAGFPALIIKILKPDLEIKLIESNGKKVSFLKYVIHTLKLMGITAINQRIERVAESLMAWGCDVVTSRAMTSLENVIKVSDPFLVSGGIIVGFLGKNGEEELVNIQDLLKAYQLAVKNSITYHLPEKDTERTTVLLQKTIVSNLSHY